MILFDGNLNFSAQGKVTVSSLLYGFSLPCGRLLCGSLGLLHFGLSGPRLRLITLNEGLKMSRSEFLSFLFALSLKRNEVIEIRCNFRLDYPAAPDSRTLGEGLDKCQHLIGVS